MKTSKALFRSTPLARKLGACLATTATVAMVALGAASLNAPAYGHPGREDGGREDLDELRGLLQNAQVEELLQLAADFHGALSYNGDPATKSAHLTAMSNLWVKASSLTFSNTTTTAVSTYTGKDAVMFFFATGGYFINNWVSLAPEYKTLHAGLPSDDLALGQVFSKMTYVRLMRSRPIEAESSARACLAIYDKKLPDDWRTFNARSLLGGSLLAQNRCPEAERFLLSGYEGMKQREDHIPAEEKLCVKEALERLVKLYVATDRPDQASEWKGKLAELRAQDLESRWPSRTHKGAMPKHTLFPAAPALIPVRRAPESRQVADRLIRRAQALR